MALQFDSTPATQPPQSPKAGKLELKLPALKRSAGATDRMFFTEQLALLLETGESLYGALTTIVQQTENPEMRGIVEAIARDVSEGRTFAHALAEHEPVFSTTYTNLIAASESGGFMHDVLKQLLDMDKKREQLRDTIKSAATYPVFLIVFSLAVVAFVLVVVFPKFGSMFTSIYDQLPASTKVLMSLSDLLRDNWYFLLAGLAVCAIGIRQWLASDNGRETADRLKLRIPGVRTVFTQIYLVQLLQVMGLSLVNGVSVMDSLNSCREVIRNSLIRRFIADVEAKVTAGAGLASGFNESPLIPDLAKHLITTGEQTGNLGKVMGRVAEYYEAQLTKRLEAVSKLAEPLMLLVMGVVVGILVSSLILPIFKLSRAVH